MALKTGSATLLAKLLAKATGRSNPRHGAGTLGTKAKVLAAGTLHKGRFGAATLGRKAKLLATGTVLTSHGSGAMGTKAKVLAAGTLNKVSLDSATLHRGASVSATGRVVQTGGATMLVRAAVASAGVTHRLKLTFHLDPTTIPTEAIGGR